METIIKASYFASEKHRNQRRYDSKGSVEHNWGSPYINHPISVCNRLAKLTGYSIIYVDVFAAALLHDVVEDTDATIEQIKNGFGDKIANIVKNVTDNPNLDKIQKKKYKLEIAHKLDYDSVMVLLADKIDNLEDIYNYSPTKMSPKEISGYAIWCKTLGEKINDYNSSNIDLLLIQLNQVCNKLIEKYGLISLEEYYNNIESTD